MENWKLILCNVLGMSVENNMVLQWYYVCQHLS